MRTDIREINRNGDDNEENLGIIGAMSEEITYLKEKIEIVTNKKYHRAGFPCGEILRQQHCAGHQRHRQGECGCLHTGAD